MRRKCFKQTLETELDMSLLAKHLAQLISQKHDKLLIFLYGELGAGKTTLTRGILQALGYTEKVKSPTYTIVESYQVNQRTLFHFDFYRLQNPHELEGIGLYEYLSLPSAICIVEWPENGLPLLPQPDLACYIAIQKQKRKLKIAAHSPCGEELLKNLV